jgi:mono/diheme cytochrome c family protein
VALLKRLRWVALGGLVIFALMQLVPYGRAHENPPVTAEPRWDTPRTRRLAARACFDCHGNETKWPWYSNIAPASWLMQRDVDEGREEVNFSEWDRRQDKAEESAETVAEGEMPPSRYTLAHPAARLTQRELRALIVGLSRTIGSD